MSLERYDVVFSVAVVPPDAGRCWYGLESVLRRRRVPDPDELVHGPSSSTIRRRLADGTSYELVKVPYQAADLEERLRRIGWDITVTATSGPFYWGAGSCGVSWRPRCRRRRG